MMFIRVLTSLASLSFCFAAMAQSMDETVEYIAPNQALQENLAAQKMLLEEQEKMVEAKHLAIEVKQMNLLHQQKIDLNNLSAKELTALKSQLLLQQTEINQKLGTRVPTPAVQKDESKTLMQQFADMPADAAHAKERIELAEKTGLAAQQSVVQQQNTVLDTQQEMMLRTEKATIDGRLQKISNLIRLKEKGIKSSLLYEYEKGPVIPPIATCPTFTSAERTLAFITYEGSKEITKEVSFDTAPDESVSRVPVYIDKLDSPINLLLSSYNPVFWDVRFRKEEDRKLIRQVIVVSYAGSALHNISPSETLVNFSTTAASRGCAVLAGNNLTDKDATIMVKDIYGVKPVFAKTNQSLPYVYINEFLIAGHKPSPKTTSDFF